VTEHVGSAQPTTQADTDETRALRRSLVVGVRWIREGLMVAVAMKQCPHCAEEIRAEAVKCRFCGSQVGETSQPAKAIVHRPDRCFENTFWGRFFAGAWTANRPASITLKPDGVLYTQRGIVFGGKEEHINYRAIASVRVSTGLFWCRVNIETSGGSQPIIVRGIPKPDAKQLQEEIRLRQQGG
jgi:hypothetical protein